MGVDLDSQASYRQYLVDQSQFKKRKVIMDGVNGSSACSVSCHRSRAQNFKVGRHGYGSVTFFGETDIRWLDLDEIVKFRRHEIVVHEDETTKPEVGKGLNKAAEFISFDPNKKEWKLCVRHFSRFGLSDDEEEDVAMDDADRLLGFKLEIKETPVTRNYSRNVVDAALFMGRSSGIAWGPNGILVHCGLTAGNSDRKREMSSTIYLEKVATDNVVRDENNKVQEELVDICFNSPLNFHKEFSHETKEVVVDSHKIKIWKLVSNRLELPHVCRSYIEIIEKKLEVPGLSASARVVLMHQIFVWELIKVLFSSKESSLEADAEALPLIRRAEFSQCGRQLDAAVELSASRGDVILACLLSLAGGIRLFELLAGNIHGALDEIDIDWKRFLGLLMWYQLSPASDLTLIFQTYHGLLETGRAPYPVPVYIDEGLVETGVSWSPGNRFDLAYYIMLLHATEERDFSILKTMFSAFASTYDPLDHHMIWHQRAVLFLTWALEILFQYCETWSAQKNQLQFIENLGIPSAWLHEALVKLAKWE
ncbi:nuclear pore complex protein NUP96-like protein isoform X1 [Tanacetum coccineum]|uniref:Nuclear pore complex protein NUP96-like protein isoform X1 n=1 Tax=Tanacetum coccineum TaxID=301880 RepID=A0ABQ5F7K5_9ASTR